MSVKLLTEHKLKLLLSLTGGCKGSSESTFFKMPHCSNHCSFHKSSFIVPNDLSVLTTFMAYVKESYLKIHVDNFEHSGCVYGICGGILFKRSC